AYKLNHMKKTLLVAGFALLILVTLLLLTDLFGSRESLKPREPTDPLLLFEDPDQRFSFRYPDTYVVVDREASDSVGVFDRNEWEAFVDATDPREGPPGISVEVFANPERLPLQVWLREHPQSNFT